MPCHRLAALTALALLAPTGGLAADDVISRSTVGKQPTIATGLDTDHAVIITKHTREDAAAFCRDFARRPTEDCIREDLAVPLKDRIEADCQRGSFTDFGGQRYRFLGPSGGSTVARYRIVNLTTGAVLDGTAGSGYSLAIGLYRALCPRHAPSDE